uniref:Uncharacterized protein n=1 Tax=Myoviridae sp. ctkfK18 TaxID=2825165 RepID=A0A8S5VH33_9CAUD|nr:MAG TPA: hypothetical protein [Myoviridae sp. ctkfK18]
MLFIYRFIKLEFEQLPVKTIIILLKRGDKCG